MGYGWPLAISGTVAGTPSTMAVVSVVISCTVKPRRAAMEGLTWKSGGGAADGVFEAVEDIDDAVLLLDGVGDAGGDLVEDLRDCGLNSLIWMGSGALERSPIMSWRTWVNSTSSWGSVFFDLGADVGDDFVDAAVALCSSA